MTSEKFHGFRSRCCPFRIRESHEELENLRIAPMDELMLRLIEVREKAAVAAIRAAFLRIHEVFNLQPLHVLKLVMHKGKRFARESPKVSLRILADLAEDSGTAFTRFVNQEALPVLIPRKRLDRDFV